MSQGAAESFGKQWVPGDLVGVFLDLIDHTISKKFTSKQPLTSFRRSFELLTETQLIIHFTDEHLA